MTSFEKRLLNCIVFLSIFMAIMIVYSMPEGGFQAQSNQSNIATAPALPDPTPTPTMEATVATSPDKVDINVLSLYDRDNDGDLSEQELGVVEIDYLYKRLTTPQMKCAVEILGYVPSFNPSPTATDEITPTPDTNKSETQNTTTQEGKDTIKQMVDAIAIGMEEMQKQAKDILSGWLQQIMDMIGF